MSSCHCIKACKCRRRPELKCNTQFLHTDGCTVEAAPLRPANCIPDNASFVFCNPENKLLSLAKVRDGGSLGCADEFLVFDATSGCLSQKTFVTSATGPLFCDSALLACQNGEFVAAPLATAPTIDCTSAFLICQDGVLTQVPLPPASGIDCSAAFLVCQGGAAA